MDIAHFPQINPPQRLLMGPGPINADPRVLRAMSSQLIGQYDPAMTHYMNEVMALYRGVFRTENRWTMLVDGTSRAGIEAILVSALVTCCAKLPAAAARRCIPSKYRGARCLPRTRWRMRLSVFVRACC